MGAPGTGCDDPTQSLCAVEEGASSTAVLYLDHGSISHFVRQRPGAIFTSLIFQIFVGKFVLNLENILSAPPHLRGNPHIKEGYRVNLRKRDCLRSIFYIHNETINIHTHLFGSLFFIWLTASTLTWLTERGAQFYDMAVFLLYCVSVLKCLISSTVYHTFGCHSRCTYHRLLAIDMAGMFPTYHAFQPTKVIKCKM